MANKNRALTPEDIQQLRELFDTMSTFHQDIKKKAQASNAQGSLVARKYFETFLAKTSNDLSALDARIRRADMASYRRETKTLAAQQEAADTTTP